MNSARPRLFAVTGRPVMHSRSPDLFNAAFAALELDDAYVRLGASTAEDALSAARHLGVRGVNVTAPFKEELSHRLAHASEEVARVGAVNTLRLEADGGVTGYNTDLFGVNATFVEAGLSMKGVHAAVLGAGGAARAALEALRSGGARSVTVLNRTAARGHELAKQTLSHFAPLDRSSLARVLPECDVVISTLPDAGGLGPLPFKPGGIVLEAAYARGDGAVAAAARERGCILLSGRRWLLFQALAAFQILCGQRPHVPAMERALDAARAVPRSLALVGFSGAGKSSVAPRVARRLGWRALDSDELIGSRTGRKPPELIRTQGEPAFRAAEREAFEALPRGAQIVLACGGGAVADPLNVETLRAAGHLVVWLGARVQVCRERVAHSGEDRPLVSGSDGEVAALFEKRRMLYARACDVVIDTEGRDEDRVAAEVVRCFEEARA